jgi:hypothetical protein
MSEAVGSQTHLLGGLFGGNHERTAPALGDLHRRLQDQGRLPHARFATDQHHRSGHEATPQNPIQFADADGSPDLSAILNLAQGHRFGGHHPPVTGLDFFGKRLGDIATRAKAHPFAGGVPA